MIIRSAKRMDTRFGSFFTEQILHTSCVPARAGQDDELGDSMQGPLIRQFTHPPSVIPYPAHLFLLTCGFTPD
jgi:hypothetical protein